MKTNVNAVKSLSFIVVCILLGILVSLQFKNINTAESQQLSNNKRLNEIQDELITQQRINRDLADRYAKLDDYTKAVQNQTVEADGTLKRIMEEKMNAEIIALTLKCLYLTLSNFKRYF